MSNIRVRIRLSGALAQMCGFEEKIFELPEGITVGDAFDSHYRREYKRAMYRNFEQIGDRSGFCPAGLPSTDHVYRD